MKRCNFFSTCTTNIIPFVFKLIFQLKHFKQKDYTYYFYLALDDNNINKYISQFTRFESEDFHIILYSAPDLKKIITPQSRSLPNDNLTLPYIVYIKCLLPTLFPKLDKILSMDIDVTICKPGIEKFFEESFDDNYVIGIIDPVIQKFNTYEQKNNVNTEKYFNSGVLMWNIPKIINDGYDQILRQAVYQWPKNEIKPLFHDQTLINYYFKNKIKDISPIYNCTIFSQQTFKFEQLITSFKQYNINNVDDLTKNIILLHFAGYKPWADNTEAFISKHSYFKFNVQKWEQSLSLYNNFLINKN